MSKNITQKIRELLTPADLEIFEKSMNAVVESKVDEKLSSLISLKEEELKTKYDKLAEEYCTKEIAKRMNVAKAKLVESYDKKLSALEEKVTLKLDQYLDHVISEQISDAMLEQIAINETLAPVVEGIKSVFAENHLKLNSSAEKRIKEMEAKLKQKELELSESIEERIKDRALLESKLEKSASFLMMSEKTSGMKRSDKQKIVEMFRGKSFEDVEKGIDNYIKLLKESDSVQAKKTKKTLTKTSKVSTLNEGVVPSNIKPQIKKDENVFDIERIAESYLY